MVASRLIFALAILLSVSVLAELSAQTGPAGSPLSLDEVVRLSQNRLSEDVIITKIRKNGKAFDLSTDEILALKKAGVSDAVVKYLLDPIQPYTPAPPPPPSSPSRSDSATLPIVKPEPPAKKYPEDSFAPRVPPEPGLYRFQQGLPLKTDIKMLLGENEGPGLGKIFMKKGKVTAYLVGPAAKSRVADAAPVFYIRLPEGKSIEELLLFVLDRKNDRRDIDMGPPGPKPELKAETMRPFDALEVGAGVFRLAPGKLGIAEYFFYLIGSADPPKGNYGKGYDFAIDAPEAGIRKR